MCLFPSRAFSVASSFHSIRSRKLTLISSHSISLIIIVIIMFSLFSEGKLFVVLHPAATTLCKYFILLVASIYYMLCLRCKASLTAYLSRASLIFLVFSGWWWWWWWLWITLEFILCSSTYPATHHRSHIVSAAQVFFVLYHRARSSPFSWQPTRCCCDWPMTPRFQWA